MKKYMSIIYYAFGIFSKKIIWPGIERLIYFIKTLLENYASFIINTDHYKIYLTSHSFAIE